MVERMKKREKIKRCNHHFEFAKWEEFGSYSGGTISEYRAIVICRKCGEIRIKKLR